MSETSRADAARAPRPRLRRHRLLGMGGAARAAHGRGHAVGRARDRAAPAGAGRDSRSPAGRMPACTRAGRLCTSTCPPTPGPPCRAARTGRPGRRSSPAWPGCSPSMSSCGGRPRPPRLRCTLRRPRAALPLSHRRASTARATRCGGATPCGGARPLDLRRHGRGGPAAPGAAGLRGVLQAPRRSHDDPYAAGVLVARGSTTACSPPRCGPTPSATRWCARSWAPSCRWERGGARRLAGQTLQRQAVRALPRSTSCRRTGSASSRCSIRPRSELADRARCRAGRGARAPTPATPADSSSGPVAPVTGARRSRGGRGCD